MRTGVAVGVAARYAQFPTLMPRTPYLYGCAGGHVVVRWAGESGLSIGAPSCTPSVHGATVEEGYPLSSCP